jgi:hypothetical protein
MLKYLQTKNVGPAPLLEVEFSERLNLLTGDNGLGKTFLLDVAWYALTETWANEPAWADPRYQDEPRTKADSVPEADSSYYGAGKIRLRLGGESDKPDRSVVASFDQGTQLWERNEDVAPAGLVISCRLDGGFSICDPRKRLLRSNAKPGGSTDSLPFTYNFSRHDLWNGVEWPPETVGLGRGISRERRILCSGLIRDWVDWRSGSTEDKEAAYRSLIQVLEALSPDPQTEKIVPGEPMRVSLDDVREIPTIDLPYGRVPVTYASAGMKRILTLAYVLVWTWYEHQQACRITKREPSKNLVLLIDELDAHLHPKWQRSIIQALLGVAELLSDKIETQIIATTHSPLILASMEPWFDETKDRVFVFEEKSGEVTLTPFIWGKYGDVASWLTSPVFGLHRGRSKEAERVIDAAYAYLRGDSMERFGDLQEKLALEKELRRVLPDDDPFLIGWEYQTKKHHKEPETHDAL